MIAAVMRGVRAAAITLVLAGCTVYRPYPVPTAASPAPAASGLASAAAAGQACHEFESTAIIGGKPQEIVGTVCQQPDGSWRLVQR